MSGGCSCGRGAWTPLSLGCTSPPGVLLDRPLRPDPRPQSCVLSWMKQGILMRPHGFGRTGGELASGWLSEGYGPPAQAFLGTARLPLARSGPREGTQAGISLVTTLLTTPFSSGSCQTEEIVSSEMNVLGKFVFPGKSCFLGPHPPAPLSLAALHAVPCAPPHAPGSCAPHSGPVILPGLL